MCCDSCQLLIYCFSTDFYSQKADKCQINVFWQLSKSNFYNSQRFLTVFPIQIHFTGSFQAAATEDTSEKGFYISFDAQPKRPKPPLRLKKSPKKEPEPERETTPPVYEKVVVPAEELFRFELKNKKNLQRSLTVFEYYFRNQPPRRSPFGEDRASPPAPPKRQPPKEQRALIIGNHVDAVRTV